ncbi:MAG: putative repeat protein (TIGR01451 family) [Halobacteriales archaeon]|jgi:uncharacterized repeat protein (TIGR01451 family)
MSAKSSAAKAVGGAGSPSERQPSQSNDSVAQDTTPLESADRPGNPIISRIDRVTNHWRGISALAFIAGGLGVLTTTPSLLLASLVGVAYLAYARVGSSPEVALSIERSLSAQHASPGDEVEVTVTVQNEGDSTLTDLRLIDGVPSALSVAEGVPRLATSLRPGASATFRYTALARRGQYEFDTLVAIARDPAGSIESEVEFATETTLTCTPSLDKTAMVPLRALTSQYTGRVETDTGGDGVEFFSTREYHPGDNLSRIDWNRYARERELTTIEFREERMATVVLMVDLRTEAYKQAQENSLHAVDRSVDAAGRLFTALLDTGDRVGIASLGPKEVWLSPGTGNEHRAKARKLLGTHSAFSPTPNEQYFSVYLRRRRLLERFPADAQVIMLSPMVDDTIARTARLFDAHGHLVTVISPNVTNADTTGHTVARIKRRNRISDLRKHQIRVVDWDRDESLAMALERTRKRWRV